MTRRLAALLVPLAAAGALAGCGGSDGPSSQSATQVLRSTFGPDREISSGQMDLTARVTGLQASQQPLTVELKGPFQGSGGKGTPRFDLDGSLTARGVGLNGSFVSTGEAGFLGIGSQAYRLDDRTYAEFKRSYADQGSSGSSGTTLGKLGIDPLRWLSSPRKVGQEEVAGTKAEHVTAGVDVPKLLDDLQTVLAKAGAAGVSGATGDRVPTSLTAAERQAIEQSVRSSRFDVWTGEDDGILRRVAVSVAYDVPQARRDAAGGLTAGTIDLGLTLADLNEKQTIATPQGARPISELSQALGQLSQGATGGATGG